MLLRGSPQGETYRPDSPTRAVTFCGRPRFFFMNSTENKLEAIARTSARWLEPEGRLSSYQAMMEIISILEEVPRHSAESSVEHEAEQRRWQEDSPFAGPPAHETSDMQKRPPRKLRASSFLG
jgi:hypothetical protein